MAESLNRSAGMTVEEIRQLVESGEHLLESARDITRVSLNFIMRT